MYRNEVNSIIRLGDIGIRTCLYAATLIDRSAIDFFVLVRFNKVR